MNDPPDLLIEFVEPQIIGDEDEIQDESSPISISQRMDNSVRNWENSYFSFHTVKMRLKQFLREPDLFIPIIQDSVKEMNHIILLAYHLINFHFLRALHHHQSIPETISPTIVYRSCSAVSVLRGRFDKSVKSDPFWRESVTLFRQALNQTSPHKRYPFPERSYRANLFNTTVKQMLTAFNNNFNVTFKTRLARYLQYVEDDTDKAESHYWADRILNLRTPDPDRPSKFDNKPTSEALIKKYQTLLGIDDKQI